MRHADVRSALSKHIAEMVAQPANLPVAFRPYQVETLLSTSAWLADSQGTRRAYVAQAPGLGKTHLFAGMISAASGMRSLVVVPTRVLLEQTARVVARYIGGTLGHLSSLAHIQDDAGETIAVRGLDHSSVVITTDASFNKLAAQIGRDFDPQFILRDECHWGYSAPAVAALEHFPEAVIVGFSGTPDYLTNTAKADYVPVTLENGQVLYGPRDRFAETHFQTCLDRRTIRWGIENGWLAPFAWGFIDFDVSLEHVPVVDGPDGPDYDKGELADLMSKHWSVMCETVRRLYDDPRYDLRHRQAIAVCPSVDAAVELAEAIGSLGVPSACIHGNTSGRERNILLPAFRDDQIRLLTSVRVLREGFDARNAEVCMMLTPTRSRVMYEQPMGRVLRTRKDGSPKVALVLDAHFQGTTFSPLSAPVLFGTPGTTVASGGILIDHRDVNEGRVQTTRSPYLPRGTTPKLVIVESLECEPWAGPDGFFDDKSERWGTVAALSQVLGLSRGAILYRMKDCRHRPGKNASGAAYTFYALADVEKVCADLLGALPQAGADGTFEVGGETWVTINGAPALLGRLTEGPIRARMIAKYPAKKGRIRGRIYDFYALTDVRNACSDLLEILPLARADGTFDADGETWGTRNALAKLLALSGPTVTERSVHCRKRQGKKSGVIHDFYTLSDIKKACADLLVTIPHAGPDGTFQADGETWGTPKALSRILLLADRTIAIRSDGCRKRQGKNASGSPHTFYALSDVEKACAAVLNKKRRTGSAKHVEQETLTHVADE